MQREHSTGHGIITLIMLFVVLALSVLAALSYHAARTEYSLSSQYAGSVSEYYAVDARATQILSRLKKTANIPEEITIIQGQGIVIDATVTELGEVIYSYTCPMNEEVGLFVQVKKSGRTWEVLSWALTDTRPWEEMPPSPLWQPEGDN